MAAIAAGARPKEQTWEIQVIRADGTRTDSKIVAYWHRNPILRWYRCWKWGVNAAARP